MPKRKQSTPFQVRQGDVLITAVTTMPPNLADAITADPRGLVLAEGEATGHAHSIAWDAIAYAGTDGASLYFRIGEPAPLTHQEHDAIPLPAQDFKVTRQREYSPAAIRNVAD